MFFSSFVNNLVEDSTCIRFPGFNFRLDFHKGTFHEFWSSTEAAEKTLRHFLLKIESKPNVCSSWHFPKTSIDRSRVTDSVRNKALNAPYSAQSDLKHSKITNYTPNVPTENFENFDLWKHQSKFSLVFPLFNFPIASGNSGDKLYSWTLTPPDKPRSTAAHRHKFEKLQRMSDKQWPRSSVDSSRIFLYSLFFRKCFSCGNGTIIGRTNIRVLIFVS